MKQETWKKVYAPNEPALELRVEHTLRALKEDGVKRAAPRRMAVLAAAAVMLVSSVALAAGLLRAPRYDAKKLAQETLTESYGLTRAMDAFFACEVTEDGDETVVTFTPVDSYMERLGVYTVRITDGRAQASWSGDGKAAGEDIWDTAKLAEGMERRAAGEEWYKILAPEDSGSEMNDEKAIAIAQDAVMRKYGPDALPDTVQPQVESFYMTDVGRTRTMVYFYTGDLDAQTMWYRVDIWADDQSIDRCACMLPVNMRTLPAGDLSAYEEAVREYVACGAPVLLSDEERYAVAQRIRAAGLGDALTDEYADPASVSVTRETAQAAATDALDAQFGLNADVRTLFTQEAALVTQADAVVWRITLEPNISVGDDDVLLDGEDGATVFVKHSERMGTYEARIDANSGQLLSTGWTLDGVSQQKAVPETWGTLDAYDAQALAYLKELLTQRAAIYAKYDEETSWNLSPEDSAALDALMRASGFSAQHYNSVMPEAGELTQAEATQAAKEALMEDAGLTAQALGGATDVRYSCYQNDGRTLWDVTFYLDGEQMGIYVVEVDAASGEIVDVVIDSGLAGNG